MVRTPDRVRVNDLISSIQDHLEYLGCDALVEARGDEKIIITIPEW